MSYGTGRQNLAINGRAEDVNWWGGDAPMDLWQWTKGWKTPKNYITEYVDLSPSGQATTFSPSGTTTIPIERYGERLQCQELHFKVNIVKGTGNVYPEKWLAHAVIDKIAFEYANREVLVIKGQTMHARRQKKGTHEQFNSYAALEGGPGSTSYSYSYDVKNGTGTSLGSGTTTFEFWVQLPIPWRKYDRTLGIIAFPNILYCKIYWKAQALFLRGANNDHATTFSDVYLRSHFVHLEEPDRKTVFYEVNSDRGHVFKTLTQEYEIEKDGAITTKNVSIRLENIKNSVVELRAYIRKATWDTQSTLETFEYKWPASMVLEDGNQAVTNTWTIVPYMQQVVERKAYPLASGDYIPTIYFCPPEFVDNSEDNCYGSRLVSKYNTPTIKLNFEGTTGTSGTPTDVLSTSGTAYAVKITLEADVHNVLIQRKGDFRRFLV